MPTALNAARARRKKRYHRRHKLPHQEMLALEQERVQLQRENVLLREVLYAVISQDPERVRASVARAEAARLVRGSQKYHNMHWSADLRLEVVRLCENAGPGHIAGILRKYQIHPRTYYRWKRDWELYGPKGLLDRWQRRQPSVRDAPNTVDIITSEDRRMRARRLRCESASPPMPVEYQIAPPPNAADEHPQVHVDVSRILEKVRFVGEPPEQDHTRHR